MASAIPAPRRRPARYARVAVVVAATAMRSRLVVPDNNRTGAAANRTVRAPSRSRHHVVQSAQPSRINAVHPKNHLTASAPVGTSQAATRSVYMEITGYSSQGAAEGVHAVR